MMKIGLLECDHVRDELLHIAGDYRQMFPALFLQAAPDWEFQFFDVCNGHFPDSVDSCDVYICTGSKSSVYDEDPWIAQLMAFVKAVYASDKYFVGVCFGHQILGEALGGKVMKSEAGWCVGVHKFTILQSEHWMVPAENQVNLLMMCQDQVLRLPENATLLAEAQYCPHAMFRVGDRMLGIQAHPEFPKVYDKALMELRVERIGEAKVKEGIESLEKEVDALTVAGWIRNFVSER